MWALGERPQCRRRGIAYNDQYNPAGVTRVMKLRSWSEPRWVRRVLNDRRGLTAGDWWAVLRLDFGGHQPARKGMRPGNDRVAVAHGEDQLARRRRWPPKPHHGLSWLDPGDHPSALQARSVACDARVSAVHGDTSWTEGAGGRRWPPLGTNSHSKLGQAALLGGRPPTIVAVENPAR